MGSEMCIRDSPATEWWCDTRILDRWLLHRRRSWVMNLVPVHGSPALHFKDESALLLADLHYGVEAEMLRGGVWVPNRSTSRTEKVLELLKQTKSKRLILLGDVKHQVPHNSKQQRTDIEQFFTATTRIAEVDVIPGNHDGGLKEQAPSSVTFHKSSGCVIGNVGMIHGHAWPSQEVMNSEILVMGHGHPTLSFRDRLDTVSYTHLTLPTKA